LEKANPDPNAPTMQKITVAIDEDDESEKSTSDMESTNVTENGKQTL